jgi:mannitol/fructose-specific phosphotransferase system IIA component (Ntr-type)
MSIPVSLIYDVRACKQLYQCTNCARLLYYPETRTKGIGRQHRRTDARKTGITRFSSISLMLPHTEATEQEEIIKVLCEMIEQNGFVDNSKELFKEALKREAIINTAVDNGLAFPHVRGIEGGGLTLALATSAKGIQFDPTSKNKTHIIFFMVIPTAASVFYLRLVSGLVQSFMSKENRDTLLAAETQDDLWTALVKTTKAKIK